MRRRGNPHGMKLKVFTELEYEATGIDDLLEAIDRINIHRWFVIVAKPSHDYMQVGGSNGLYTVEARDWGEPFCHVVAGKEPLTVDTTKIPICDGNLEVRTSEVLTIADVRKILGAYFLTGIRPEGYFWRDVTAGLLGPPPSTSNSEWPLDEYPPPA